MHSLKNPVAENRAIKLMNAFRENGRSLLHFYCTALQAVDYQWSG
jgi:hypothetical protein